MIYLLWIYMRLLIKSFKNIYALEIDDTGITINVSRPISVRWDEIAYFSTTTVQMTSGRHSKIHVHTHDTSNFMITNTDLLAINKDELLVILEQNLAKNNHVF
ncbi:hypothetical protein [Chryseobacterium sp. 2R14A]|uniref:hypothetical protein n=1 Tax=Chryseobacterium sp. 2R14A TaxID=3380353 RepID=UPI003CF60165